MSEEQPELLVQTKSGIGTLRFNRPTEAYDMGLINRVVEVDELDRFTSDYAEAIAANAPLSI